MLPAWYLDAVVALERMNSGFYEEHGVAEFDSIGSGVLLGEEIPEERLLDVGEIASGEKAYFVYLVTNEHVVGGEGREPLYAKINVGGRAQRYRIASHNDDGMPLGTRRTGTTSP